MPSNPISAGGDSKLTQSIRVELTVESPDLSLAEIEAIIGRPSDPTGQTKGEASPLAPTDVRVRSTWVLRLNLNRSTHTGTQGLDEALRELPDELADQLAAAREAGCAVVFGVVQNLSSSDSNAATGLHLSGEAIGWLARARALLDVDQYVD